MIKKLLRALGLKAKPLYILVVYCGGQEHVFGYSDANERQTEYNALVKVLKGKRGGFHTIVSDCLTMGVAMKTSEITGYTVIN